MCSVCDGALNNAGSRPLKGIASYDFDCSILKNGWASCLLSCHSQRSLVRDISSVSCNDQNAEGLLTVVFFLINF